MNTRTYRMGARAESVEATRRQIIEAQVALSEELPLADITLSDVADRAGVSVQTVLRQFGSKEGLRQATGAHMREVIAAERRPTDGSLDGALSVLVDHYERRGDMVLLMLAQERSDPQAAEATAAGRRLHRQWVRQNIANGAQDDVVDLLVVATDLYTWKILRRDRRLSRARTEARMKDLVSAVLTTAGRE